MATKEKKDTIEVPPGLNAFMKFMLRTPLLHNLVSSKVMLITFKGRKSGKTYSTPVSYYQEGNTVLAFTNSQRLWWRNFIDGNPITIRIKGKNLTGTGTAVVDDKEAIAEGFTKHLKNNKIDAKIYGVTYDTDGSPNQQQVRKLAEDYVIMIEIKL
jgi:hypothetical protein